MHLLSKPTVQNKVQRCWGTSKSLSALELVALKFLMRMFLPAGRQARKEASLELLFLLGQAKRKSSSGGELKKHLIRSIKPLSLPFPALCRGGIF
jgi:hypothetical protein